MRWFGRIRILVLAGAALVLLGIGGCSPGSGVWRIGGDGPPVSPLSQEAAK